MSAWGMAQTPGAHAFLKCGCCMARKHEKNGDARCDTCVASGCVCRAWGGYKAMPGCLRKAKRVKQSAMYTRSKP